MMLKWMNDSPIDKVIKKLTDEQGKIKNEFICFGIYYLNPASVSVLTYDVYDEIQVGGIETTIIDDIK